MVSRTARADAGGRLRRTVEQFGEAVRQVYKARGFRNQRDMATKTGIHFSVISRMLRGEIPGGESLIKWADYLGEPAAKWLALSQGLEWEGVETAPERPVEATIIFPVPPVPSTVTAMIEAAESNEDKVTIAFNYLRSVPGLQFGADQRAGSYPARLAIIRLYEKYTGLRLLPLEVF